MPRIHMEAFGDPNADTKNRFTLYWIDGKRNVIKGDTIDAAFAAAGYGGGSIAVLDFYEEGITESRWWSKSKREWIPYAPFMIESENFSPSVASTAREVHAALETSHCVTIVLPNKDQYTIAYRYGCFAGIGWVKYIEIVYGEYCRGNYGDDEIDEDSDEHHFMACAGEYFDPEESEIAAIAFVNRYSTAHKSSGYGISLEELKSRQMGL